MSESGYGELDDHSIRCVNQLDDSKIYITGISGRYPGSENVDEFFEHMANGVDLITEDSSRWEPGLYGLPRRHGKLLNLDLFDANAFGISPKQAHAMDPQLRKLLEVTYEAFVDAGRDPKELRGSNTGVFVGASDSESVVAQTQDPYKIKAYSLIGGARAMFANRISYTYDLKGPSCAIDTACSSSLLALAFAYDSMRLGRCDSAIVAGVSLTLSPNAALQFKDIGMLSDDGKCKSFDATGTGYVRSECVSAVFLEKVEKPCRIYCEVVHARSNTDGYKLLGATFPSGEVQQTLLEVTYGEAKINPADVSYVEAHGTGTMAGDPQEVNAIANVLCTKERVGSLLIGSVKASMGHAEPASGVASLSKIIACMEKGMLVPQLHYEIPNPEIPSLIDGKIKVVTDLMPWNGGFVGINSFGFGGANVHAILKSCEDKLPSVSAELEEIQSFKRLIRICGRTEAGLQLMFQSMAKHTDNDEYLALLDKIANQNPNFCKFRGFVLSDQVSLHGLPKIQRVEGHEKRPIWFVYSGMGTQYVGMAVELMHFDVFRNTIAQCDLVMKPLGINLSQLIMTESDVFNTSILMAFVGLCCIQIALTNLLRAMNIQPDGIVGHSIGELCCAYADGCLTLREVVTCAYWRGKCVEDASLPSGAMAAIGMSWEMASEQCPEGVEPACHNSADSVTISGRKEAVLNYVEELTANNIFAKEVDTLGFAFHSTDMKSIGPVLEKKLKQIIDDPKMRSKKWVSTSVLIDEDENNNQNEQLAKTCSAEYLANNLCSPVYFHEAMTSIPENAIVVEIAPHCLMQAILRRTLPKTCSIIGVSSKKAEDKCDFTLESIGKVYNCGVNIDTGSLYKEVKFPVSKGTPMIGPIIKWDHSEKWYVASAKEFLHASGSSNTVVFSIDSSSTSAPDNYLTGHKIDGRILYPFTGYLVLAWRALAQLHSMDYSKTAVEFEEIVIHRPRVLSKDPFKYEVSIMKNQGQFEIVSDMDVYCSGKIKISEKEDSKDQLFGYLKNASDDQCEKCGNLLLSSKEIYAELQMSGYEYENQFRSLQSACNCGGVANVEWSKNYVTFIDAMLQTIVLSLSDGTTLMLPTRLRFLRIDPELHLDSVIATDTSNYVELRSSTNSKGMIAGGIELADLTTTPADRKSKQIPPTIEKVRFTPFEECSCLFEELDFRSHIEEYAAVVSGVQETELVTNCPQHHFIVDLSPASSPTHENEMLMKSDCLYRNAWHTTSIKALGDIITENVPGNYLNSCIVDGYSAEIAEKCKQAFELSPLVRTTWTAANGLTDSATFSPIDIDPEKYPFISTIVQWADKSLNDEKFHVILADYVISSHSNPVAYVELLSSKMHDGGFILASEQIRSIRPDVDCRNVMSIDEWKTTFDTAGLRTVAYQSDQSLPTCLFLLRKVAAKLSDSVELLNLDLYEDFSFVEELQKKIIDAKQEPNGRVHMVTHDKSSGIVGFMQSLRPENEINQPARAIMIESDEYDKTQFNSIIDNDLAFNTFRDGIWGTWRHFVINEGVGSVVDANMSGTTLVVTVLNKGDLNSLKWVHDKALTSGDNIIQCRVKFASLNFRDVMLATGRLSVASIPCFQVGQQSILGCEFSGYDTTTGQRVMGVANYGGLAVNISPRRTEVWEVPENWTLEEAASVPVAYMTAYYALVMRGRMQAGDTVLIHSGSGGVGMAAINICLANGATVYTTVGVEKKRQFLAQQFGHHENFHFVGSTRNCKFEQTVLEMSYGRGVDIVLNSLSEDKLQASVRCLAMHGRFCEIGKYDMSQNSPLGMSVFLRNVDFQGILVDSLDDDTRGQMCADLFSEGIRKGHVIPLNTHIFESDQVPDAFRFMAQGKHMGKVLIKVDESKINMNEALLLSTHKSNFEADHVYLVTGGLGGVGLQLAKWLSERGARKLVLTSRSGLRNGNQKRCVKKLRDLGVDVEISTLDVAKSNECEELIKSCQQNGPLGGIFHLAMVLRDVLFEDQSADNFVTTSAAKISGTKNLDVFTRRLCGKEMKYFVAFSSIASGRGNKGQTAYAWSNSAMERIIANRKSDNFAGMAIQWGAIGDTGIVMEIFQSNDANVGGTLPQRIENVFKVFDWLIGLDFAIVSSFVRAPTEVKHNALKSGDLLTNIANVLGASDIKAVDLNTPLGELGLDSLMGAEIRQMLEGDYDIILSMKEIRAVTIKQLQDLVKSDSGSKKLTNLTETGGDLLKLFSVRVNPNELLQTEMIVKMNNVSEGSNLFFVHSIEGISTTVKELSILINCPVYCLQQTPDVSMENMRSIAQSYIQAIKSVQKDGPYNLAGYSFGGCIAYEITKCLNENDESVQNLIFLDTSHIFMDNYREMFRAAYKVGQSMKNNPVFEAEVLCGLLMRFCEFDYRNIRDQLMAMTDWDSRLNFIVDFCMEKKVFTDRAAAEFSCSALRDKLIVADSYHPESVGDKLNVAAHLIRAEKGALDVDVYGNDYSLSDAFVNPVAVTIVTGDHDSFIHDAGSIATAQIINDIILQ